ncbi:ATP-binding protein [Faecalibaculum rodentium]|jgi:hypothetical protein|uniref:ATP-binding protein n=1 Tax=Faecalibaculum rodentium TaxID=1702221 RepID=UPI00256ECE81|nr:ATP-binding protein [Faecalibaculum rodentium]
MTPRDYYGWTRCFALFRGLEEDPVIHAFYELLKDPTPESYAVFVHKLYETGNTNWTRYFREQVLSLETGCVKLASRQKMIPAVMLSAAKTELYALSEMALLSPGFFDIYGYKAGYTVEDECSLYPLWLERVSSVSRHGFGAFAKWHMFRLEADDRTDAGYRLLPVTNPDPVKLSDLVGYKRQQQEVLDNTQALANGAKAANILLYGDAGTGKSATVKAVANELRDEGIRLIELNKSSLHLLPGLLDELAGQPLKFILFIDDLSFRENDDDFAALKAVLEGSASTRSRNTVIYATSNRRHIVKETFQAREGDEIHRQDTMQETVSLSERFGLRVYFEKPDKALYLQIVDSLAKREGIREKDLVKLAEQFALRKAGRSARAARQLVDQLAAKDKGGETEC